MKNIIGICGSASQNSSNLAILKWIAEMGKSYFNLEIMDDLTELPHFRTELTSQDVPERIVAIRKKIAQADGILICTPEYVFSIPSGLKNMIEWFVSTTLFSDKPAGLITASANGERGHEELKLIMETVQCKFTEDSTLLIQAVKGKLNKQGQIIDEITQLKLTQFIHAFCGIL